MAQPITAQFITDTGFATGLTPTVTITMVDGTLIGSYPMVETSAGNYLYMFDGYNQDIVYFFNYDAGTDDVINRYQGSNNNTPSVLYSMSGGTNAKANDKEDDEKKLIDKIKKELETKFDELEEGHKKLGETLGVIVDICKNFNIEFDDSTIINSIEKNTKLIQKKIDSINIPTYKEATVIDSISKKINSIDIPKYDDTLESVHSKLDTLKKIAMTDAEYEIEKYIKDELDAEDMITKNIESEDILQSLLKEANDSN